MFRFGIGGRFGPFWAGWLWPRGRRRIRRTKYVRVERRTTYVMVPRQPSRLERAYQEHLRQVFEVQRRDYIRFLRWKEDWEKAHPGERWQAHYPNYVHPPRPYYPNTKIPITVMKSELYNERQVR